jgi:hypothetical protein
LGRATDVEITGITYNMIMDSSHVTKYDTKPVIGGDIWKSDKMVDDAEACGVET